MHQVSWPLSSLRNHQAGVLAADPFQWRTRTTRPKTPWCWCLSCTSLQAPKAMLTGLEPATSAVTGRCAKPCYTSAPITRDIGKSRTHLESLWRPPSRPVSISSIAGGIRTHTVLVLSEAPPAGWATATKYPGCDSNAHISGFKPDVSCRLDYRDSILGICPRLLPSISAASLLFLLIYGKLPDRPYRSQLTDDAPNVPRARRRRFSIPRSTERCVLRTCRRWL